ncbi:MAG: polysaccharide pyruvyl transferase family protein [Roseovarius sp.]
MQKEFPSVTVAPGFTSPSEAKSYIAGMDFFMGARMHACIAAFSAGVPVVPMAYSRKFAGLFGALGYNETVDCTSQSAEEIMARVFDAYGRRAELVQSQKAALATGLEKLARYEAALGDLMVQMASIQKIPPA